MKRNIKKIIGLALVSSLAFANCHEKVVTEKPILAALLNSAINSAASGACIINVNSAAIFYGALMYHTIMNTNTVDGFTRADYNAATNSAVGVTAYALMGYEEKTRAFFLDNGTAAATGWNAQQRNARLQATKARFVTGYTFGASPQLDGALQLMPQLVSTGIMTCGRIPRTSCSVAGLTTANREIDIANQVTTYNAIVDNKDCRKPSATFNTMAAKYLFRGVPETTPITLSTGTFYNTPTNGVAQSSATNGPTTAAQILPVAMYPKSGALVGQGFGNVMPINLKGTAYPQNTASTDTTAFYGGQNLTVTQVASCEAYGFSYGVSPTAAENLRKPLTSPAEIAYAFSTNGTAASVYQAVIQITSTDTSDTYTTLATAGTISDAVACNNSFRAKQGISTALGGGKLPTTNGGAQVLALGDGKGDDRASSLLALCVYGGTSAKRATAKTLIGAGLVTAQQLGASTQLATCGEGQVAGGVLAEFATTQEAVATPFAEVGPFGTFPNSTGP